MKRTSLSPMRVLLGCSLVFLSFIASRAQEVRIEHNVPASSSLGWHPQYETQVDPENASNMIVCGIEFNAKDNAFYEYVSFSADQGKNWHLALEPRNSTFESEESCAYGVHGVAYFVTAASKVIDGVPHHEQGITRIYVSHDAGKTWRLGAATGWNDYTTAVVDTTPGPNQNRLYSYFNNLQTFYSSIGQKDAEAAESKASTGTRIGMISYKDGDTHVAGPYTSDAMAKEGYRGSYPAPAILLKDGTIVTVFTSKRRTEKNERELMAYSVRTSADRASLDAPVKMVDSLDAPADDSHTPCGDFYLDPATTYDSVRDKLYFLYSGVRNKVCSLLLTTSTDDGKSWSKPQQIYTPSADGEQQYANPAIAVNKDGVLAIMWAKAFRSGCWMFATSADDGKTLSRATHLGTCSAIEMKPSQLSSNYLWESFFQADPKRPNSMAMINLRNTHESVWRNKDPIAVTPDGAFHPVWTDAGNGEGELRTAAIYVTSASTLISNATPRLADVTTKVAILFGGDQNYDPKTKLITLDVVIRNSSDHPLTGPFKLAVPSLYKDYGFAEIANADDKVSGGGAVWDISATIPGGLLAPGATSKPFALKFRYTTAEDTPRNSDDILGLSLKVFAAK